MSGIMEEETTRH
jgi:hypothetical protein